MKNLGRFRGSKLEILIRLASGFFQHSQGDECDLWKLTEFNSDTRFEVDASNLHSTSQFRLKMKKLGRFRGSKLEILIRLAIDFFQHGQGDECDLWKLTEFNSDSQFEVPSASGVGGDEHEDEEDDS
ncbi:hypothetical protein Taro_019449 [Colocasia esculenta]|uniref:Uncharacterized protein n=1 Tax=Colocasia esculenta TaxID=4460 RepID=A0A843UZ78_COLES|nr:hypothetical protein [Colocasia esculenta]